MNFCAVVNVPPETQFDNGQVDILLPSHQASCRHLQPAPRPCAKLRDVTLTSLYAGFVQSCLMLHLLRSTRTEQSIRHMKVQGPKLLNTRTPNPKARQAGGAPVEPTQPSEGQRQWQESRAPSPAQRRPLLSLLTNPGSDADRQSNSRAACFHLGVPTSRSDPDIIEGRNSRTPPSAPPSTPPSPSPHRGLLLVLGLLSLLQGVAANFWRCHRGE